MSTTRFSLLLLVGCAASAQPARYPSMTECPLPLLGWEAASDEVDVATSKEVRVALRAIAEADRDHYWEAADGHGLGTRLREIKPSHRGFIDQKVAALGEQLRQLDCAVILGAAKPAETKRLYDQIVVDLGGQPRLQQAENPCREPGPRSM